ncbi:MAG: acyltransferase [Pseudomonadota bacterium]
MTVWLSLYLDALRFLAAIAVLLSHWAYPRFSGGDYIVLREINIGSDAVVLFFVLSGFVITYAGVERDKRLNQFLFNRATRLYSVAIPALVLTFLLDRLGVWFFTEAYQGWWYQWPSAGAFFGYGLSFTSEWQGHGFRMGTNGPYWSLSYEAAYYIAFAIAFYMTGVLRGLGLLLCALVFGVNVLLLMPCWLMGVGLYRLLRRENDFSGLAITLLIVIPPILYCAFVAYGIAPFLKAISYLYLVPDGSFETLRFSDEFLWNWIIGLLFAVHLWGVGLSVRRLQKGAEGRWVGWIRWSAGASFSLYLVHYPVMQFLSAALPFDPTSTSSQWLLLLLTIAASFLFASLFERPLPKIRKMILRIVDRDLRYANRSGSEA